LGDGEQEDDVEQRSENDERLAPAPSAHGVVADRSNSGLDDDADDRPAQADDGQGTSDFFDRDVQLVVHPVLYEQTNGRVDRGEPQPVGRQADEMRERQMQDGTAVGVRCAGRDGCAHRSLHPRFARLTRLADRP
jgi:hypothetical protein